MNRCRFQTNATRSAAIRCISRRENLLVIGSLSLALCNTTSQSKAENNGPTELGPIDDTLGSCAGLASCVSSYDDRPDYFIEPWELTDSPEVARNRLMGAIRQLGASKVEERAGGISGSIYIRASFGSDEVEFLLVSDGDRRIELRSSSNREGFIWEAGRHEALLEDIRSLVGYPKLEVLRNRQRRFIFIESPWDTFGPAPPIGSMDSMVGKKMRDLDWEDGM